MLLDANLEDTIQRELEQKLRNNELPDRYRNELRGYDTAHVIDVSRSLLDVDSYRHVIVETELEHVVNAFRRPSLLVRNDVIEAAASEKWQEIIDPHRRVLSRAVSGVGRIELKNHILGWAGTGFLVKPNLVVTNRHVALDFVKREGAGASWRINEHSKKYIRGRIDFLEEYQLPGEDEFEFESVEYLAQDNEPDVALLKLSATPDIAPLSLSAPVSRDTLIVTIGYPWRDSRVSGELETIHRRVFNDIYDKKRASPGKVLSVHTDEIKHDCSTLGGNSGSACVDIETGSVVGLHYGGEYVNNVAVSAEYLQGLVG